MTAYHGRLKFLQNPNYAKNILKNMPKKMGWKSKSRFGKTNIIEFCNKCMQYKMKINSNFMWNLLISY